MEHISFEGVNLAELLPRIPDSIKDGLPFGLVKLDYKGTILEYNMAEGELTGIDPKWAIGKNFFDDVALCTKTQAFYGRFLEGVKKGFLNAVFDYTFDHREIATQVKVHMVTIPNHRGEKNVMILVKRSNKPLVLNAVVEQASDSRPAMYTSPAHVPTAAAGNTTPSMHDIVSAVMAVMNQGANTAHQNAPAQLPAAPAVATVSIPTKGSRHEDILKF